MVLLHTNAGLWPWKVVKLATEKVQRISLNKVIIFSVAGGNALQQYLIGITVSYELHMSASNDPDNHLQQDDAKTLKRLCGTLLHWVKEAVASGMIKTRCMFRRWNHLTLKKAPALFICVVHTPSCHVLLFCGVAIPGQLKMEMESNMLVTE